MRSYDDFDDFDLGYADLPGELYDIPSPIEQEFYSRENYICDMLSGERVTVVDRPASSLIEFQVPGDLGTLFDMYVDKQPVESIHAEKTDDLRDVAYFYADRDGEWGQKTFYMEVPVDGDLATYKMMIEFPEGVSDDEYARGSDNVMYESDIAMIKTMLHEAYDSYMLPQAADEAKVEVPVEKGPTQTRPLPSCGEATFDVEAGLDAADDEELPF